MASDESGAEEPQADKAKEGKKPEDKKVDEAKTEAVKMAEEPPVITRHVVTIDGQELRYTVTTGLLPIKNEKGEIGSPHFLHGVRERNYEKESATGAALRQTAR